MAVTMATIKRGSRGNDVAFAQALLFQYGADYLSIDGIFGAETERYVKEFQRECDLAEDGIIGPNTWSYLAPTMTTYRSPYLPFYSEALRLIGHFLCTSNCMSKEIYDTSTTFDAYYFDATKLYQKAHGLTQDGKWGKQCWSTWY